MTGQHTGTEKPRSLQPLEEAFFRLCQEDPKLLHFTCSALIGIGQSLKAGPATALPWQKGTDWVKGQPQGRGGLIVTLYSNSRVHFSAQTTDIPGPKCEASWIDNATRTFAKTPQSALPPTKPVGRHLLSPKLSPGCAHFKIQTILGTSHLPPERRKGPWRPQCNSPWEAENTVSYLGLAGHSLQVEHSDGTSRLSSPCPLNHTSPG